MQEDKIYQTQPVLELSVKRRPGRKRKLTPVVFEKIMVRIEDGDRLYSACAANGVSQKTLLGLVNQDHQAAQRYAVAKTIRLQRWHEQWLGEMCQHSEHSPWATGWLLERNFPSMYGLKEPPKRETLALEAAAAQKVQIICMPADEIAKLNGPEYTLPGGNVEREIGGVLIRYARLT